MGISLNTIYREVVKPKIHTPPTGWSGWTGVFIQPYQLWNNVTMQHQTATDVRPCLPTLLMLWKCPQLNCKQIVNAINNIVGITLTLNLSFVFWGQQMRHIPQKCWHWYQDLFCGPKADNWNSHLLIPPPPPLKIGEPKLILGPTSVYTWFGSSGTYYTKLPWK